MNEFPVYFQADSIIDLQCAARCIVVTVPYIGQIKWCKLFEIVYNRGGRMCGIWVLFFFVVFVLQSLDSVQSY